MKKTKILALCLSVLSLSLVITGCGKKSTDDSSTDDKKIDISKKEDVTLSMLYNDNATYPLNKDWDALKWIKEKTGVTFNFIAVSDAEWDQRVKVAIGSGDMPDLICKQFPNGVDILNGSYLALSDYEKDMPNFKKFIDDKGLRPLLDTQRMYDGKYYILPMKTHSSVIQDQQWYVREDIFKKNNIKIPTTLDEMYEAGKKLKEIYPDSAPISNRYGSGNIMTAFSAGFGTIAGWTLGDGMRYDFDKKKWEFAPTTDNWKNMLTYLAKMSKDGVLDQEYSTADDANYEGKILNGKSFMMYDWSANIKRYTDMGAKKDPDFKLSIIVPPKGPTGKYAVSWKAPWGQGAGISAKVKDDPKKLSAVLRLINWGYSDEAETLLTFGKEGETYEKNPETQRLIYKGSLQPNPENFYKKCGLDNNCLVFREHEDFLYGLLSKENVDKLKEIEKLKCVPSINKNSPLTKDQNEDVGEYTGAITDYVNKSMEKMIVGKEMSAEKDWDAYVKECENRGSKKLLGEYEKAEKAMDKK